MKFIKENGVFILILALITLIIIDPVYYSAKAIEGFTLWFLYVLPSLFPFFFLSLILTKLKGVGTISKYLGGAFNKTFNVPKIASYAALTSYISGYPIGAKITSALYENGYINSDDLLKTSLLSSSSGPVFIIGTVGGMIMNNALLGVIIYFSHIASVLIFSFVIRGKKSPENLEEKQLLLNSDNILSDAIYNSVNSILIVGGYIGLFYVFVAVIEKHNLLYPIEKLFNLIFNRFGDNFGKAIISGVFEATQGIKRVFAESNNIKAACVAATGLITFGGLSINAQNLTFLDKCGIKKAKYLLGKVGQSAISCIICAIILIFY